MKSIRRYYTRKEVAELLGVKGYQVSSKISTMKGTIKWEIKRQEKMLRFLSVGIGKGNKFKFTEKHIELLREQFKPTNHEQAK